MKCLPLAQFENSQRTGLSFHHALHKLTQALHCRLGVLREVYGRYTLCRSSLREHYFAGAALWSPIAPGCVQKSLPLGRWSRRRARPRVHPISYVARGIPLGGFALETSCSVSSWGTKQVAKRSGSGQASGSHRS